VPRTNTPFWISAAPVPRGTLVRIRLAAPRGAPLCRKPPTERRAEYSQAPPFVVGEPCALVAQAFQNPVLFAQILDDLVLLVLEQPTRNVTSKYSGTTRRVYVNVGRCFGHYAAALGAFCRPAEVEPDRYASCGSEARAGCRGSSGHASSSSAGTRNGGTSPAKSHGRPRPSAISSRCSRERSLNAQPAR
jgi:hypothetical protein